MPSAEDHRKAAAVILYDGVCGLCNRSVRFVLRHDREGIFRFASLQSAAARQILARHGMTPDALDTFYVVTDFGLANERVLSKSDAVIYTVEILDGIWKAAKILRFVRRRVRDWTYGIVARHRYQVFGKYDACPLPEARYRDRFIELGKP